MAFGKTQKPQLTGPDYLLGVAKKSADAGQPFAAEFQDMVWSAFTPSPVPVLAELEANRPLRDHEASPVSIILGAVELANQRKDQTSVDEILKVGLSLLAKWPAFLLSRVDGHPDFDWKDLPSD